MSFVWAAGFLENRELHRPGNVNEPPVRICLQYLYPEAERSFFRAREFELSGDEISRTCLFGNAPDLAGIALAVDCLYLQFNESDFFTSGPDNALRAEISGPNLTAPRNVWISDYGGFSIEPLFRVNGHSFLISFAGQEVGPSCHVRIQWEF